MLQEGRWNFEDGFKQEKTGGLYGAGIQGGHLEIEVSAD